MKFCILSDHRHVYSDDIFSDNWENNQNKNNQNDNNSSKRNSKYIKQTPTQARLNNIKNQVPVNVLPEKFRSIFTFTHFNAMQSESFNNVYNTNDNCVISSPTGSGKTALFELAIIKLLNKKSNSTDEKLLNSKILYMAPTKALCKERYDDWCTKFQPLNYIVGLLTGDSSFVELDSIKKSDLIVCTPEKWDALTRKWTDYSKLLDLVKLLLVDEIHFLREKRGTSLEVVITRMMTLSLNLRIIALSATVPNIQDVSNWLGKSSESSNNGIKTHTMVYNDEYRAVSLEKTVYGYKTAGNTNPFKFEIYLNGKLPEIIRIHSKGKPVLIFCPTRNSTIGTAKHLAQEYIQKSNKITNIPNSINKELIELIQKGVAYHHAGLSLNERKFVETNFINGNVKILCSTSTLAVGVNLPAYLVIIKGTKVWNNNALEEYNELDLMQMMGRAGRPQFETKGACVIMTDDSKKDRYIRLVKGTEKLESSLHLNIYENITAEITLKTIRSLETAFIWLQCTFFYQRYIQNPTAYPTIFSKANSHHSLDIQLKIFLKTILDELENENMIFKNGQDYESTAYGTAMSKSYVLFETVKLFVKSKTKLTLEESLSLIVKSFEFKEIRVKMADKRLLKEINNNPMMNFKIDRPLIENYNEKISILIQFELGGIEFPSYQGSMKLHHEFISEKMMVFKNLPRILKAAIDIYSYKKDAISLNSILKLNRSICAKSWENSALVLKQFDGIGLAYAKKLNTRGLTTIDKIKALTRDKLEYYLGMKPGAGQKIFKSIINMPQLSLKVENLKCESNGYVQFTIAVNLLNEEGNISFVWNGAFAHINVLTDLSGTVLDFRRLPLKKLVGGKSFTLKTKLKYKSDYIKVYLNIDEIVGVGKFLELNIRNATQLLKDEEIEHVSKHSISFEFSDDDVIDAVFGENKLKLIAKEIPKSIVNKEKITSVSKIGTDIINNSVSNVSDVSDVSEPSIMECNHKCVDKNICRHICCKEGIPRNKVKQCKHACKDKSKCRHMCCREQVEYETKLETKKLKKMRQNTLDLSIYISDNSNEKSEDCPVEEIDDNSSDINMESKLSTSRKISELPVFLRRIDTKSNPNIQVENTPEKVNYGKLETSKYFTPKYKKKILLDMPSSEDYSGTFDSELDKAIKMHKRSIPLDENMEDIPIKKQKAEERGQFVKEIKDINIQLPKLNTNSLKNDDEINIKSVEDVVIVNQSIPKVVPLRTFAKERINKIKVINEPVFVDLENKENDESNEGLSVDYTTMTSMVEDVNHKEIFGFLDSDIEFE